jgi:very-short-patch-repair endonuclease
MEQLPDPDWYLDHVLAYADPGPPAALCGPADVWSKWWHDRWLDGGQTSLGRMAREQGFVLTTAQARRCGLTTIDVRRAVRRGRLTQPGRGTISLVLPGSGDNGRRRRAALTAAAGVLRRPDHVVTGRSAAIVHGLPIAAVPQVPELTARNEVTYGRRPAAHVHRASLARSSITSWYGVPVTDVARTLADLGRHNRRDAIMAADAALREGLTTRLQIERALSDAVGWPYVRQARHVLALASPSAESPLESITRLALHDSGFPLPEEQVWIGEFRVDFLWPAQRLILEADGRGKYAQESARWNEKLRERALRRLGYQVERVIWADIVDTWPATCAHLKRELTHLSPGVVTRPAEN